MIHNITRNLYKWNRNFLGYQIHDQYLSQIYLISTRNVKSFLQQSCLIIPDKA